jgi:hypothetical protein
MPEEDKQVIRPAFKRFRLGLQMFMTVNNPHFRHSVH